MRPSPSRLALVVTALVLSLAQEGAEAGLFKKKKAATSVPTGQQMQEAEKSAADLMATGKTAEEAGKESAALSAYRKLVLNYPYSTVAPAAQFRIATMLEQDRKFEKAFDAYQELITNYRQTPQFSEALEHQFTIAMMGRKVTTKRFLGIKIHASSEEVVAMLGKVIANAPQGSHAAEAQFEIGRIHDEEKEPEQAIAAYRKVADNYPRSSFAIEAQKRIGQNYIARVQKGSRDTTNIEEARNANQEITLFGDGATADPTLQSAIDDASAKSSYENGRFYQKRGNFKAAMLYYSDILKNPGAPYYEEVRERVNEMSSRDPKLMDSVKHLAVDSRSLAVPAAADLKGKPGYYGPPGPAPKLAANVKRPQMRNDYVPYQPLEPGDLPTTPGTGDPSLLDPNNGLPPPTTPATPSPEESTTPAPVPAGEPPALDLKTPLPPSPGELEALPPKPKSN